MIKNENLRVRDPFVLCADGVYYLYKATETEGTTVSVHTSTDLKNWSDGTVVYTLSQSSWGLKDLWAPEVHFYNGKYYMFLSLLGKHGLRGTEISVCDTPNGTFVPLSNEPATPKNKSCIDGSLYLENGAPYIVYSLDWPHNYDEKTSCYVGEIWALRLSNDLTRADGEPFRLFRAIDAPAACPPQQCEWEGKTIRRYGSDAPFIQTLSDGRLYLTWSPIPDGNYVVAAAISKGKSIKSEWEHLAKPLFAENGGHAMFFTDVNGNKKMCLHHPEVWTKERATFFNVKEQNGRLVIAD